MCEGWSAVWTVCTLTSSGWVSSKYIYNGLSTHYWKISSTTTSLSLPLPPSACLDHPANFIFIPQRRSPTQSTFIQGNQGRVIRLQLPPTRMLTGGGVNISPPSFLHAPPLPQPPPPPQHPSPTSSLWRQRLKSDVGSTWVGITAIDFFCQQTARAHHSFYVTLRL